MHHYDKTPKFPWASAHGHIEALASGEEFSSGTYDFRGLRPTATLKPTPPPTRLHWFAYFRGLRPTATLKLIMGLTFSGGIHDFRGLRPTATLKLQKYEIVGCLSLHFRGLRPTATLKRAYSVLEWHGGAHFRGLRPTATLKRSPWPRHHTAAHKFPWASAHGHIEAPPCASCIGRNCRISVGFGPRPH